MGGGGTGKVVVTVKVGMWAREVVRVRAWAALTEAASLPFHLSEAVQS